MKKITLKFTALLLGSALATSVLATENSPNSSSSDYELEKVLILLLNLFKIGYNRRFQKEKNNPDKWWYWDLSDDKKINLLNSMIK